MVLNRWWRTWVEVVVLGVVALVVLVVGARHRALFRRRLRRQRRWCLLLGGRWHGLVVVVGVHQHVVLVRVILMMVLEL